MSSDKAWQPSAEQRLAPRKPWRGAATLQVGQAALAVRGVDLSETGAGVACGRIASTRASKLSARSRN